MLNNKKSFSSLGDNVVIQWFGGARKIQDILKHLSNIRILKRVGQKIVSSSPIYNLNSPK